MKALSPTVVALVLGASSILVTGCGPAEPPAKERSAAATADPLVKGWVIDPDGRPLTRFRVKARVERELPVFGAVLASATVENASDGAFEIRGVPAGSYFIEGLADGFASSFSGRCTVTPGTTTSDVVVRMTRGGSLQGVVLAGANEPLADAEVTTDDNPCIDALRYRIELFPTEPSALTKSSMRTDSEGHFTIGLLTPGSYQVQILAEGLVPVFVDDVVIVDGQDTVLPTQTLAKGAEIAGMVFGRDGSPAPGAAVDLTPADQGYVYGRRTTRADEHGRYRIEGVALGKYQLSAVRTDSGRGGAFEVIEDMNRSKVQVSVEDARAHAFDLTMKRAP